MTTERINLDIRLALMKTFGDLSDAEFMGAFVKRLSAYGLYVISEDDLNELTAENERLRAVKNTLPAKRIYDTEGERILREALEEMEGA